MIFMGPICILRPMQGKLPVCMPPSLGSPASMVFAMDNNLLYFYYHHPFMRIGPKGSYRSPSLLYIAI